MNTMFLLESLRIGSFPYGRPGSDFPFAADLIAKQRASVFRVDRHR